MTTSDKNPHGIRVKRCCASCAHKRLTRTTMRWCRLWDRLTCRGDVCDEWTMSKQLRKLTDPLLTPSLTP